MPSSLSRCGAPGWLARPPGPLPHLSGLREYTGSRLYFKIGATEYNCVRNSLMRAGFRRTSADRWNVFWGRHLRPNQFRRLNAFQRVRRRPRAPASARLLSYSVFS